MSRDRWVLKFSNVMNTIKKWNIRTTDIGICTCRPNNNKNGLKNLFILCLFLCCGSIHANKEVACVSIMPCQPFCKLIDFRVFSLLAKQFVQREALHNIHANNNNSSSNNCDEKKQKGKRGTSESTFLPVRHVRDLRYCFALLACSSSSSFFSSAIQISTKYYKSGSDRPRGHVKICNTRHRAAFLFFVYSTKAEKIPCLFGQCLRWEVKKCGKRRSIRLYTMIDGEKVLFALWIFHIFSYAHIYSHTYTRSNI